MSHSKILTSFLDEIVNLAWLLYFIISKNLIYPSYFWDAKVNVCFDLSQKNRDNFSGLFPLFLFPSSHKPESYLF